MRITVEVVESRGLTTGELAEAISSGESASLEMPGWGSAPDVKIVEYREGEAATDRPCIQWIETEPDEFGIHWLMGSARFGDRVFDYRSAVRARDDKERLKRHMARRIGAEIGEWMAGD